MKHLLLALLLIAPAAHAQTEPPKHEFRGAWIATVTRIDWPASTATAAQQAQLISILDQLEATGINAAIFQVRTEGDALYDSDIEPWSYWLTGVQGQAPDPYYDPLAFAIEEAHERGMELHAWFNPYRMQRSIGSYPLDPSHVAVEHPEWTFTAGGLQMLDPGIPEVRDYIATVVADVVRRYDVDGVHFDDYFYPYPPNQITDQDDDTFAEYDRGFTNRGDWRRDNINLLVAQVSDSIAAIDPEVKFGISPFGIWKNGVPSGIVGMDAYNVIYADATAWMEAEDLDYLTPQLYWPFGGGQDYGKLAPWWATQTNGRHLYPGLALYKNYPLNDIPRQIRLNRDHADIQGQVMFTTRDILANDLKIQDSLRLDLYRYPALTPPMSWKSQVAPAAPTGLAFEWTGEGEMEALLTWNPPAESEVGVERYAVYRVRSAEEPDWETALTDARNLIAVTGDTSWTDSPGIADDPYHYVVTAVSANSIESDPTAAVSLEGRAVAVEAEQPLGFRLDQNYPNPFNPTTTIAFTLERPTAVTVRVYDLLGRRIATLADGRRYTAGPHTLRWHGTDDAGNPVASGTYLYELEANDHRQSRPMTLLK